LTMGKCGAGIVFAQQGKRAPDHGGTGVERETHPRSLVGSSVYDSRVVPVVGAVGSDLGGCGLVGRAVVAARSALTHNLARVSSRSAPARGQARRTRSAVPPSPKRQLVPSLRIRGTGQRAYRKEIAYFSNPHTLTFRRI